MPITSDVFSYTSGTAPGPASTTISSSKATQRWEDVKDALNTTQSVARGGTGATTVITAHDALTTKGTDIASASTINLTTATGAFVDITGATTVTAVTLAEGSQRIARAVDAFQLTASASLIVNGSTSVNYTTTAGELLLFEGYGSSVVRVWAISLVRVSSTTDDAIVRFDGTNGAQQNSSVTIPDGGAQINFFPPTSTAVDIVNRATSGGINLYTNGGLNLPVRIAGDAANDTLNVGGATLGAGVEVKGIGTSDTTNSLEVKDSAGTLNFYIRDDGYAFSPPAYSLTTGDSANMVVGSDGVLSRSVSALKYKNVIGPIPNEMTEKVMALSGFVYTEKDKENGRRFIGMAADDFHSAGLTEFVSYGQNGEVEGLMYERLIPVVIEYTQSLARQLREIKNKLGVS